MNKLTMKMRLFAAFLLLGLWGATAQTAREQIAAMPERAGGIYHSYEYLPGPAVPAPKGYVPFYISHYGRHGSRWHTSEKIYAEPLGILRKADSAGVLTPKGRDLLAKVEVIAADARDRYGDLSPRGVAEHRGIAERMYKAYPEVFSTGDGRECYVQSRSTLVPRCILSMAAFNERLKELNPEIRMTRESSQRYIPYMSNGAGLNSQRKASGAVADSLQDASDLFTEEEIYAAWEAENFRRYVMFGPSKRFGDPIIADAKPLLRNIVETAERVVAGEENLSASLRFGHDVNVIPLVALLGVREASGRVWTAEEAAGVWQIHRVSPMATNVQFIFFRNPETGDVRVRVLHNERDAELPVGGGPYYPWETLRDYCKSLYE